MGRNNDSEYKMEKQELLWAMEESINNMLQNASIGSRDDYINGIKNVCKIVGDLVLHEYDNSISGMIECLGSILDNDEINDIIADSTKYLTLELSRRCNKGKDYYIHDEDINIV